MTITTKKGIETTVSELIAQLTTKQRTEMMGSDHGQPVRAGFVRQQTNGKPSEEDPVAISFLVGLAVFAAVIPYSGI